MGACETELGEIVTFKSTVKIRFFIMLNSSAVLVAGTPTLILHISPFLFPSGSIPLKDRDDSPKLQKILGAFPHHISHTNQMPWS